MLGKLFGNDDENRDLNQGAAQGGAPMQDRHALIRERMQAQGISEEEATRLILSEEELRVGKREVAAGEVEVTKHVDTHRVHENVALRHDEVEVERRPITDGYAAAAGGATIGQTEEIRIPLHSEEAVVEKRVVPTEEVVVRKRTVTENETVEADLRRERAEVNREGAIRETDHLSADRSVDPRDRI